MFIVCLCVFISTSWLNPSLSQILLWWRHDQQSARQALRLQVCVWPEDSDRIQCCWAQQSGDWVRTEETCTSAATRHRATCQHSCPGNGCRTASHHSHAGHCCHIGEGQLSRRGYVIYMMWRKERQRLWAGQVHLWMCVCVLWVCAYIEEWVLRDSIAGPTRENDRGCVYERNNDITNDHIWALSLCMLLLWLQGSIGCISIVYILYVFDSHNGSVFWYFPFLKDFFYFEVLTPLRWGTFNCPPGGNKEIIFRKADCDQYLTNPYFQSNSDYKVLCTFKTFYSWDTV